MGAENHINPRVSFTDHLAVLLLERTEVNQATGEVNGIHVQFGQGANAVNELLRTQDARTTRAVDNPHKFGTIIIAGKFTTLGPKVLQADTRRAAKILGDI